MSITQNGRLVADIELIEKLKAEILSLKAQRIAYALEFDGDEGSIHQSIRNMKARNAKLEAEVVELPHLRRTIFDLKMENKRLKE